MEQKNLIEDNSGDKKYFTIIPNYIANHSTANDQALYFQLKRLAGDSGKNCYPSNNYLMEQLGIGIKALRKSFEYVIEKKWITNLGKKQIMTAGGMQWVNVYKINDIWKLNIEHFEGGAESTYLTKNTKGVSKDAKGVLKDAKGVSVVGAKEERKKNVNNNIYSDSNESPSKLLRKETTGVENPPSGFKETNALNVNKESIIKKQTDELIDMFKSVNPTYKRLFGNITERSSLERLVKEFGRVKVVSMIEYLPQIFGKPYAPRITTPYMLEKKLADLIAYKQSERSQPKGGIEIGRKI